MKTDSIKSDIESGLKLLMNLQEFFVNSDYEGKRILAGAIFSEKLIFGNENCRTTKLNEVIEVLTSNSGTSEGIKKRKAVKNDSFSVNVPKTGLEPAHPKALRPERSASTNFATWAFRSPNLLLFFDTQKQFLFFYQHKTHAC